MKLARSDSGEAIFGHGGMLTNQAHRDLDVNIAGYDGVV